MTVSSSSSMAIGTKLDQVQTRRVSFALLSLGHEVRETNRSWPVQGDDG